MPSPDLKEHAPKIIVLTINPDKIREVIGPGGKMVKSIVAATGVKIDIEDDGRIHISSADQTAANEAIRRINEIIEEAEIGPVYHGVGEEDHGLRRLRGRSCPAPTAWCTSRSWRTTGSRMSPMF